MMAGSDTGNGRASSLTETESMLAQPRQQGAARRIGQRRERAIQRLRLILNHVVRYLPKTARCQVRPAMRVDCPSSARADVRRALRCHSAPLSAVIPGPERSEGARNPVITACGYSIPGSPLRGAPE